VTLVRIAKNWTEPELLRQTPGGAGIWDGIQFTLDAVERCDYLVVLNYADAGFEVECPPDHAWALIQEPPTRLYRALHATAEPFARVYGTERRPSQPALPWHVERDYDELVAMGPPEKTRLLSAIASSLAALPGHRARLRFLAGLGELPELDRFGRGVRPLADKWDGLAPYRYSLAIENMQQPHYWTEKLADCFLAWTLPLYAGCPNLEEYFPAESFVRIDLDDPDTPRLIAEIARSDRWVRSREAIEEARRLVLERYQLFPFLAGEIARHEAEGGRPAAERIVIPGGLPTPLLLRPLASTRLRHLLVAAAGRAYALWRRLSRA
jgi:hypothetical protein